MPAIVTNDMRIRSAAVFARSLEQTPTYVFVGKRTQWNDDDIPPDAIDSVEDRREIFKDVVAVKRILPSDIVSVIPRRDWQAQTVYDQYDDQFNLIDDKNPETNEFFKFYVITSEFNVYKCLSNNYRSPSTTMPSGTSITPFQTPDGYLWKYMYTVRSSDVFRFMTPNWIPCYTLSSNDDSSQWLVQQSAIDGTIDNIVVTNAGANYDSGNPPTVTISGDGAGASAVAEVNVVDGTVDRIIVTDNGSGYTYATATIDGGNGVGAEVDVIISPIGGHGNDPLSELGGAYAMVRVPLEGDESGTFPTDISYRTTGLISQPLSTNVGVAVVVQNTFLFQVGETLQGASSNATGSIVAIDPIRNYLYVNVTSGQYILDEQVQSQDYNTTAVNQLLTDINLPMTESVAPASALLPSSGDLMFFAKREKITRDDQQTEEVRLIIHF